MNGRVIALLVIAFSVNGCGYRSEVGEFSLALGKKLQAAHPAEVDLATVGSFIWDELFIFGPYSMRRDVCKTLGLGLFRCRTTVPSYVEESSYLLVFRKDAEFLRSERHSRSNGDFYAQTSSPPQPVQRANAKFTVVSLAQTTPQGGQRFQLEYKK